MILSFNEIPGWKFEIYEKSIGVYKACGKSESGNTVSYEGSDPDLLLKRCKEYATNLSIMNSEQNS